MTDRLALPRRYQEQLEALLSKHVPGVEVWAYGSRVNGRSHAGSDLDLVLRGPALEPLDGGFYDLLEAIEQSNIPILIQAHDWAMLPESFHREIKRDYVVVQEGAKQTAAGEWQTCTLGELTDNFDAIRIPIKETDRGVGPYPYYGASGVVAHVDGFLFDGEYLLIAEDGENLRTRTTPIAFLANGKFWVNNHAHIVQGNSNADTRFLKYALSVLDISGYLTGSTMPKLTQGNMNRIPLLTPPLPKQRTIAHVLGTLDDKIELNRRMNETLEAMARALFKSWFVDFDPVRAKMDGRWQRGESLPGLPADLYDLFPNRLVDSELGKIPEGWEVGVLDDAIEILSGGTPRTSISDYWDGDIPWYTAKDAPSLSDVFVLETERTITEAGIQNSATSVLPMGTTIITARGTVGRLACLGIPMAMNQTCYGIRGAHGYPDLFTYWNVRMAVDALQQRTHGTIFDTVTRQTFKLVETVLPAVEQGQTFDSAVKPVMGRILSNLQESRCLAAQRDALLPGLVSGEVGVGEPSTPLTALQR